MLYQRTRINLIDRVNLLILLLFVFFRPLSLMGGNIFIGGLNTIQFFAVASSYVFLLMLLFNLSGFKLDYINILIFIFCLHASITVFWGGDISRIARLILPCVVFYTVRSVRLDNYDIKKILLWLIIGYSIPILGSFLLIVNGKIAGHYVYYGDFIKAHGVFLKSHPFGHSMAFFSFIVGFYLVTFQDKTSRPVMILILSLLLISFIDLFFSHVRTAYLGSFIFWFICLFFINRKVFFLYLIFIVLICMLFANELFKYLLLNFHNNSSIDINDVSTGRITIWSHNILLWSKLPFEYKFAGIGFGAELKKLNYISNIFWSSHNDYLAILVQGGLFSLALVFLIYLKLFTKMLFSSLPFKIKIFFVSLLVSVLAMNAVSNSYWHRPELAQLFWLMMAFMYQMSEKNLWIKTTTPAIRKEIQNSNLSERELAKKYGISRLTVRRWKKRDSVEDRSHRPHNMKTTLTPAQEAVVVELRKTLLLPFGYLQKCLGKRELFACRDV